MRKPTTSRFFLEMFSIVFAVLLALWLDEWKEQRKQQKAVKMAKEAIIEEVKDNLGSAEIVFANNSESYDSLRARLNRYESDPTTNISTGMTVADMSDVAWATSNTSQISRLFDRELLFDIERIYQEQELYDALVRAFRSYQVTVYPELNAYSRSQYRLNFLFRMNLRVEELIEVYRSFLERYETTE